MFDELEEQMELPELKRLVALMSWHDIAARVLNMLCVNFSNDQNCDFIRVDQESVQRFKLWIKTGLEDDAIGLDG